MDRDEHAMSQAAAWEQQSAAAAAAPVLSAQRVEKTYRNGTHALDEVRLDIGRGEFVSDRKSVV